MSDALPVELFLTPGRYGGAFIGVRRRVTVPAPAAGAEWSITVPPGTWHRLLLGRCTFTASAVVANRFPMIRLGDGNVPLFDGWSSQAVTASQAPIVSYRCAESNGNVATGGVRAWATIPEVWLPGGYTLGSITPGLDVGDAYSSVELLFDELDEGYLGMQLGRVPAPVAMIETL